MNTNFHRLLSNQQFFAALRDGLPNILNLNGHANFGVTLVRLIFLGLLSVSGSVSATVHYQINLKTSNNYYVVAEGDGGGAVNANRTAVGPWESFTLIDHNGGVLNSGDSVSIRTGNGHYFQAGQDGGHDVSAVAPQAYSWETFIIEKPNGGGAIVAGDKVALRTGNGHYFRAENNGGGGLDARAGTLGCPLDFNCSWELFELVINHENNVVSFASGFNGRCLDVNPADNNLRVMDCSGAINQLFTQQADGSITSLMNNYCIDAAALNGNAYMYSCHGGGNQRWNLANGELRDLAHNQCIDLYAFNNSNGANVQMYNCNDLSNQRWHMMHHNFTYAPEDQRTTVNQELFAWSNNGAIPGMSCIAINETLNNQAVWGNNYFCTTAPANEIGLQYSMAGPITGKRCSLLYEGTNSWGDNYLCVDRHSNYVIHWDWANKKGPTSVRFNEPGENYWSDNYLTIGYVGDDFLSPAADKAHNGNNLDNYNWTYFFEDVIFDSEFYCPLLNFANYLGYAWAGCSNPNIWFDSQNNEYVIQSPQGNGYRGNETLQTRIKDLRVEMDAATISLGDPVISPSSTSQNVKTATFENQSYQDDVQEFRVTVAQQNCWSRTDEFTFGQSVSVTGEKKWKTEVSEASISVTIGLSFEQAFSDTTSNCTTQNETIVTRVTVPARSRVTVSTAAINGQVTIPYTAKVNLGYTATFWNFLRWSGNAHNNHPTDRPYHSGVFGQNSAPYKSAPDAIVESFNEKNSLQRAYEWDWNWMFGTYGVDALKNTMSGVTRKHTRNVNGEFYSDGVSYVTTIGAAQPL